MKRFLTLITLMLTALTISAQNLNQRLRNWDSSYPGVEVLDSEILSFMDQWHLKGMSVSVVRNDSLVFAKGYGWADEENAESMNPGSLFRIASVSKLVTAIGVMVLVDEGKLGLHDKVFGPDGILDEYTDCIRDTSAYMITVENLLRHEGGFYERNFDPMFSTVQLCRHYGIKHVPTIKDIIPCVLSHRLDFYPGTSQSYSNFGYAVLSAVIEKVTGEKYEAWMQEHVLKPAGCVDMHIAGNYYEDRYPGEVRYYAAEGNEKVPEYNCSGNMVDRCYGGSDIAGLAGAGGWVASTPELAKLVCAINGLGIIPDIISPESFNEMIRYYDDKTYSLGWVDTRPDRGWTRTGTLAGTSALVRYFPDGECWVLVTNTGTWKGPKFSRYTKGLVERCRDMVYYSLPVQNLF